MTPEDPLQSKTLQPAAVQPVRDQDKPMLLLSYLGPLALVPLLTVKDSEFVRWHAKNGLVLGVGGFLTLAFLLPFLRLIPFIGCLAPVFIAFAALALVVCDVYAALKAFSGERLRIPVVSELAEKL